MPKAPSNPPFKAAGPSTRSRRRSSSTMSSSAGGNGHGQDPVGDQGHTLPALPSSPRPQDGEPAPIPGSALDQDQDDHGHNDHHAHEPMDIIDEPLIINQRPKRARSMSSSNAGAAAAGRPAPTRRSSRSNRGGGSHGPPQVPQSPPPPPPPTADNSTSITGRFHFNTYASFGRDDDLRSSSALTPRRRSASVASSSASGLPYHHHGHEHFIEGEDEDDGDDSLFPHSDSDSNSVSGHAHHPHSHPPARFSSQRYSHSQFHPVSPSTYHHPDDNHMPSSPPPSSPNYPPSRPPPTPPPPSSSSKSSKRGPPPLKVNLNDPSKSNLALALEQSEDVDQDQLALLGPPSYEEMISDAILALDKADAMRHNVSVDDHEPLGQKPADIFGYILTKFKGQLSTAFRGSATQALKKGLRRGRFWRVAPGTKPGYAGNGGYAVNKEYAGRTARGRAKKNHGTGVLGSPTSAKYAALQAARIAAIHGDEEAAAVLEQARQQQMKTRRGGKKGGVEFDEWEALLAPPIPGVGYVMPPGMEAELEAAGEAFRRKRAAMKGKRKRRKLASAAGGSGGDGEKRRAAKDDDEDADDGGAYYDAQMAAMYASARGARRGAGSPTPIGVGLARSRPMRAARSNVTKYVDRSESEDEDEDEDEEAEAEAEDKEDSEEDVQYLRRQRKNRYDSQEEQEEEQGAADDMDVDPPNGHPRTQRQQQPAAAAAAPPGPKGYRRAPPQAYASFYDPMRDSSPVAYSPLLLQPRRRGNVAHPYPAVPPTSLLASSAHPHAIQPQPQPHPYTTSPALHRRTQPPTPLYIPSPRSSSSGIQPIHPQKKTSNDLSDDNTNHIFHSTSRDSYSSSPPQVDSHRPSSTSTSSSAAAPGIYNPNRRRSTNSAGPPPPPPSHRIRPRMVGRTHNRSSTTSSVAPPSADDRHTYSPPPVITYPSAPSPIRRAERQRLGVDASFYRVDAAAKPASGDGHTTLSSTRTRSWGAARGASASPPGPGPLLVLGRSPEGSVVTAPLASPPPGPAPSQGTYYRGPDDDTDMRDVSEHFDGDDNEDESCAYADGDMHQLRPLHSRARSFHLHQPHATASPLGIRNLADSATSPNMHGGSGAGGPSARVSRSAARASVLVNLMPLPGALPVGPSSFSSAPPSPEHEDQLSDDAQSLVASAEAAGCTQEDAQVAMSLLALFGNASVTSPSSEIPVDPFAHAAASHPSPPPTAPSFAQPSPITDFHPHVLPASLALAYALPPHSLVPYPPSSSSLASSPSMLAQPAAAFASTSSAARALVAVMSRSHAGSRATSPQVSPRMHAYHGLPSRDALPNSRSDERCESQGEEDEEQGPMHPPPPVLPLMTRGSVVAGGESGSSAAAAALVPARVLPPKASMANMSFTGAPASVANSATVAAVRAE